VSSLQETLLKTVDQVGIKRHLIHGHEMRQVLNTIVRGDCVLARAFGEATTELQTLIGGYYTHTIMINSASTILDARGDGIRARDILDIFPGTQAVWVGRPILSDAQIEQMLYTARAYAEQHKEYDWSFGAGDEAFYCSEFYWACFDSVYPGKIKLRSRLGRMTIIPDDLRKHSAFKTILEIKR
jgi:uncharacterized protein YycO